ncbi:MAG: glycosyltransferase family 39 protein [Caldilineaceae bacterium]|nr:glycosyltransferase family 39 protein [Caldilineaceae bacterium]
MKVENRWVWPGGGLVLMLALLYHLIWLAEVPPGLDRDAAANGRLALNWLRYGIVPFWIPHASAPEPLIAWMQTATTALLGPSVAALRVASAISLSLAALVTYWLALEVARPYPRRQRLWAALFAGIIMACNPLVSELARTGLRATTLPLVSALFFLFLLRAWRTASRRDFVISGLLLGTAAYTYLAARFLPIVVLVFVGVVLWAENRKGDSGSSDDDSDNHSQEYPKSERRSMREHVIGLLLMGFAALIVVLPQLIFFAQYPTAFWERAQSVSLLQNPVYADIGLGNLILRKVAGMLLMFGIEWSGQYNQAARPLLLPLPFIGLLLSLPVIFRWRYRPAMLLMVAAMSIMLLPDLIGGDRLQPHELRVIGAFVPIMVLSGMGLAYGLGLMLRFTVGKVTWGIAGPLLALLLAGWGLVDWFGVAAPALAKHDYDWFARPDVAIARAINANDQPLIVPLNDYSRAVIAYLTAARVARLQSGIGGDGEVVKPSSDRVLLLWPADPERVRVESVSYRFDPTSLVLIDGDKAYLMPPARADVAQIQGACTPQPFTTDLGEEAGALCEVDFDDFNFPAQLSVSMWPVHDLYAGELQLRGISADSTEFMADANLGITSFWQAAQTTRRRWRYFVHLLDDHQGLVAGDDLMPGYGSYETPLWQTDEIVPIRQVVRLPGELLPGRYWIEVGLYDPLTGKRALIGDSSADRTLVGPLKVPLQERAELPNAVPLAAHFGDEIALDSYQLARSDEGLEVTLRLSALRRPARDYTIFLHVEQTPGEIIAQSDAQPRDGQYPTGIWDAGEEVVSTWRVALPASLPPGSYKVWMGVYYWENGERLPIQGAGVVIDADRLLLGEVDL